MTPHNFYLYYVKKKMEPKHWECGKTMNSPLLLQAQIHPNTEQACCFAPESFAVIWLGSAAAKRALFILCFSRQIVFFFQSDYCSAISVCFCSASWNYLTQHWCYFTFTLAAQYHCRDTNQNAFAWTLFVMSLPGLFHKTFNVLFVKFST